MKTIIFFTFISIIFFSCSQDGGPFNPNQGSYDEYRTEFRKRDLITINEKYDYYSCYSNTNIHPNRRVTLYVDRRPEIRYKKLNILAIESNRIILDKNVFDYDYFSLIVVW